MREPIAIKRVPLTPKERAAMERAQGGKCAADGCESTGPFIAEHWLPCALGNTNKPDCLLCRAHAKTKTATDVEQIARAKRRARYQAEGRGRARSGKPLTTPPGYKHRWAKRKFGQ